MEIEITIRGQSLADINQELSDLQGQINQGPPAPPRALKTAKVETEPEGPQGSIFGGEPEQAPAPTPKATKGKKTAAPAAPEPESNEDDATEYTSEDLANGLRDVISKCGGNGARAMMSGLGYPHLGKVPKAEYGKFMQAVKDTIAKSAKK